jgi:hypothetical protein
MSLTGSRDPHQKMASCALLPNLGSKDVQIPTGSFQAVAALIAGSQILEKGQTRSFI